ncbi:Borealin-like protein [Ophiocordyceps camponoti-floridani]|uniref:Borealin-like protein n=1 Tax=Ophiocordyceps camponoti-floridani TaxID=2030778 RepID=A0A8H4Q140_9HYPO|nr:Borealin-like protein [Ophiocordyceps camponoti-floridani]
MAPTRRRSRPSGQHTPSSTTRDGASSGTKIPLKGSPRTPRPSPIKKRRKGITLQQKQALIDNLQLEVTERARRLRAQYSLQAQGLRSRVEIRINRIPTALRKLKMGDLMLKHLEQEQSRPVEAPKQPLSTKEAVKPATRSQAPERAYHAAQSERVRDKENEGATLQGKKKPRGADAGGVRPTQVLSPTSSNSRLTARDRPASPPKSQIAQPGSPLKSGTGRTAAVSGVLSSMVERAKATRYGSTRKVTTASDTTLSRSSSTTTATRAKRLAVTGRPAAATSRPATRAGARASGTSESSEGSTVTVVRKAGTTSAAAAAAAAAATKKRTIGAIRRGVAGGGSKKAAPKIAAPASTTRSGGRTLRKRT